MGVDPLQRSIVQLCVDAAARPLPAGIAAAAKGRVVDTFAAYYAAWQLDTCRDARRWALSTAQSGSASIVGTTDRVAPEIAAFVNGLSARSSELNDTLHVGGKQGAHPSDLIMPLLAVAEHNHTTGAQYLSAVAIGYEIFLRLFDLADLDAFDYTCLLSISIAAVAATLLGASPEQTGHAVAIAVVANNGLRRARLGQLTSWKATASGEAGRAGVFAATLARSGFEGPAEPFVGESGWLENVGNVAAYADDEPVWGLRQESLNRTIVKPRSACGSGMSAVLAAERANSALPVGPVEVGRVVVETYGYAVRKLASRPHHWAPENRAEADHSLPYLVAVTLMHGRIAPELFDDHIRTDPGLREMIARVEVVECADFTAAYERSRPAHRSRVTVTDLHGRQLAVGEIGGAHGEVALESLDEVREKFTTYARARFRDDAECAQVLSQLEALNTVGDIGDLVSASVVTHDGIINGR